jgi:hypothetical protein
MSDRRSWLPEAAADRHVAQLRDRDWNCPATRTCTVSSGRLHLPAPPPRFAALSCASTWFMSRPRLGQALLRDLDEDLLVLSAEQLDLVATSGTRSNCWRTSSAKVLTSAC